MLPQQLERIMLVTGAAEGGGGGEIEAPVNGNGDRATERRMEKSVSAAPEDATITPELPLISPGVRAKLFMHLNKAKSYLLSRKSYFMRTVPSENCDIVMTFPDSVDGHAPLWLLNLIRVGMPQVSVQVRQHRQTRGHMLFITSTYESLQRGAEQLGIHKALKPQYGGGQRRFSCGEDYTYLNVESKLHFFTSQERQSIIKYWLDNLRASQGEVLHNIHFLEGQPIIPELEARGLIHKIFPLHEKKVLDQLMSSWVQAVCERQPLDDICEYFGVKIALYFAWLGFYTSSMLYPAVIGSLLWILGEADQTSQDVCCVLFAIFNVVWATLFLESWKRRGAELAFKWGTLDTPPEALGAGREPRPQFRGVKRVSPVTGCEELFYPDWRRNLFRWLVSLPVCLLCLCVVFLAMFVCLEIQEFVMDIKELPRVTRFIPKIMLAITVSVCDEVYKKIAYWLNGMENHRFQSDYENNLIIKMVVFQFINSYLSLFYLGFYLKDMSRLKEMLATLLIFRQLMQNFVEVVQPYLYEHQKLGVITPAVLWDQVKSTALKYGRLAVGKAQAFMTAYAQRGSGEPDHSGNRRAERSGRRGDLKAGFRLTVEEWDQTDGLRQRKVCFTEEAESTGAAVAQQGGKTSSFLEDSPTLAEEGDDHVFTLEDEDSEDEPALTKDAISAAQCEPPCQSGRGQAPEGTAERTSWMDPPEEDSRPVTLTQAEIESCMQTYESTLEDYQEMFIQFGYVVLFSSAFPLAAVCALVNNVMEIRSDALKLCSGLQRPFGERVESIGQWQTAMEAMGLIAIMVNCYLIGQCGQLQRLFPWLSPEMTVVCIVLLEHFAILLKYVIHVTIPDVPGWVADQMAKLEFQRREAFQKHERHAHKQLSRRREEEEELQKQAELQAEARLQESELHGDRAGGSAHHQHHHHHDKSHAKAGQGGDKPKRPGSLLGTSKLKQIIPLQGKFSSGSAHSPNGGEAKLPGFLKFLKSAEVKKEAAAVAGFAAAVAGFAAGGQERAQSPSRTSGPGKPSGFSKSEGTVVCGNGVAPARPGDAPQGPDAPPAKTAAASAAPEEPPAGEGERGEQRRPAAEPDASGSEGS